VKVSVTVDYLFMPLGTKDFDLAEAERSDVKDPYPEDCLCGARLVLHQKRGVYSVTLVDGRSRRKHERDRDVPALPKTGQGVGDRVV